MKKIVLISCVSKKLATTSEAADLYISPLFRKNLKYAMSLKPDKIFILSAKYGLVSLNKKIEPYDKTLNRMNAKEIKEWADSVLYQLKDVTNLEEDEFIFLAGNNYRKFLTPHLRHYKVPMEGLSIGKQLQWLSNRI
jgi:cytoplasmic iron level regulating protein YaaA (DUF328/UPF0246 family)